MVFVFQLKFRKGNWVLVLEFESSSIRLKSKRMIWKFCTIQIGWPGALWCDCHSWPGSILCFLALSPSQGHFTLRFKSWSSLREWLQYLPTGISQEPKYHSWYLCVPPPHTPHAHITKHPKTQWHTLISIYLTRVWKTGNLELFGWVIHLVSTGLTHMFQDHPVVAFRGWLGDLALLSMAHLPIVGMFSRPWPRGKSENKPSHKGTF